jgi:Zn-dependent metalloprotease
MCSLDPIQCIVPPHMLEAIRMRGSAAQKRMADALEQSSAHFRDERGALAPAAAFRGAPVLAVGAKATLQREVYDCAKGTSLPGKKVRGEGGPSNGDVQADQAYDGAGDTWKLYYEQYRRNSIDGQGLTIVSSVHYGKDYDNAFWNGEQMVYGDGDGVLFKPLTGDVAVIGHELSHGVVQYSGGLVYRDQSGALNEHFADAMGVLTKQYRLGQDAHQADWLVGAGILGPGVKGVALRSLAAPGTAYDDDVLGKDPQPYHMAGYVHTSSDNGGVHINSGIPNHAFYLLATMLGGKAWEGAGRIWYAALQSLNNPHATFADWAAETGKQARALFGAGSVQERQTGRAWKLVGVG